MSILNFKKKEPKYKEGDIVEYCAKSNDRTRGVIRFFIGRIIKIEKKTCLISYGNSWGDMIKEEDIIRKLNGKKRFIIECLNCEKLHIPILIEKGRCPRCGSDELKTLEVIEND